MKRPDWWWTDHDTLMKQLFRVNEIPRIINKNFFSTEHENLKSIVSMKNFQQFIKNFVWICQQQKFDIRYWIFEFATSSRFRLEATKFLDRIALSNSLTFNSSNFATMQHGTIFTFLRAPRTNMTCLFKPFEVLE